MRESRGCLVIPFVAVVAFLVSSCASTSLHTPRPNAPGDVSVGLHGGYLFVPAVAGLEDGTADGAVTFNSTVRIGLQNQNELGINAGLTGTEVAFKHGFTDYENPLQVSLIGGAGLMLWAFPDINIGAVAGFDVASAVQLYGGLRTHLLISSGVYPFANLSAGVQLFPLSSVSLLLEYDRDLHFLFFGGESSSGTFDPQDFGLASVNVGMSFNFGR